MPVYLKEVRMIENSAREVKDVIEELRSKINHIEHELDQLKEIIKTTINEMQQLIKSIQKEKVKED
jgi:flagellar capping protein FliD